MAAFVRVVDAGTFAGAARELHVPKSTLSRWIQALEDRLGAQLLVRTTRSITVTDAGAVYLPRCRQILEAMAEADDAVQEVQATPRGVLRITGPQSAGGGFIGALAIEFLERHPELEVDLVLTNRYVNLEAEGFDVAVRAGSLEDSALLARKMTSSDRILVASPTYLARAGVPTSAEQLKEHECLVHTGTGRNTWQLKSGGRVQVSGRLRSNDLDTIYRACVQGLGLALLPETFLAKPFAEGSLVKVLTGVISAPSGIYLVYPANRHESPKIRAFLDFGTEWFSRANLEPLGGTDAQ